MLYIILIIIIILLLLAFWIFIMYSSFDANIVRIREVETNIDALLKKRFDLLSKSIPVIKANIESNDDVLEGVVRLRSRKLNSFELDRKMNGEVINFLEIIETYPNLKEVDAFVKIYRNIRNTEETLVACKKYYNDTIVKYNKMIREMPTRLLAKVMKFQEKEAYSFDEDYMEE